MSRAWPTIFPASRRQLLSGSNRLKAFTVKAVPFVAWSSPHPLNFRPALPTLGLLCFGLIVFGIGEALLIAGGLGVSPWTVLAQGIALKLTSSIGWATFLVSIAVLLLWIPLRQVPGLGTLLNAILIAAALAWALPLLPEPQSLPGQLLMVLAGILMVGFGSGTYLIAHLGAGPRDGLMTGLQRLTEVPIAIVRLTLEISVVAIGWSLGGVVGVGTLLFALGIGPAVSLGLYVVAKASGTPSLVPPDESRSKSEA